MCETRLTGDIERMYMLPQYCMFSTNRDSRGGGTVIFVKDSYNARKVEVLSILKSSVETVFVTVKLADRDCLIGNIYRPPRSDIDCFLDSMADLMTLMVSMYPSAI